jgi:hypothetical protein
MAYVQFYFMIADLWLQIMRWLAAACNISIPDTLADLAKIIVDYTWAL